MNLPEILYSGSVKNVRGEKSVAPYIFEYSDRYSIFDWGQMPDQLHGKGESLAFLAWFFFDFLGKADNWKNWQAPGKFAASDTLKTLREEGVSHHALGLVGGDLKPMPLERELVSPTRLLAVRPVQVLEPQSGLKNGKLTWDYSAYQKRPVNALVPLEVIFRFGVPEGSSLLQRTSDIAYCHEIGLASSPKAGDRFDDPVIELSTKLENKDRYITYAEAKEIAGLDEKEFLSLIELASLLALRLKDCFAGIGIELWDGKFEFGFGHDRRFMLVDSIGPDELRLISGTVHLSKETLRAAYRGTAWLAALEKAKTLADERGEKDWKKICMKELGAQPSVLPPAMKEKAEMIYKGLCKSLAQKYLGKAIFADAWELPEVISSFEAKKKAVA